MMFQRGGTYRVGQQNVTVERDEDVVEDPDNASQDVGDEEVLVHGDPLTTQLSAMEHEANS